MKATYTTTRDDKKVTYDMKIDKDGNFFEITCVNDKGEKKGFVTFEIYDKYLWIYKIETEEKFQHQGVGSALIKMLEYFAMKNRKNRIEAKYYPSNKFAKPLYLNNGYFIPNQKGTWDEYDETWTMYKFLDLDKTKEISKGIKIFEEKDLQECEPGSIEKKVLEDEAAQYNIDTSRDTEDGIE